MGEQLVLQTAGPRDIGAVLGLIREAARWLAGRGSDQWAKPWPSETGRRQRILAGLRAGKTWIAWDGPVPVATITADPEDSRAWPPELARDRAIYVSRLVVSRAFSGRGLGAQLLDWAGLLGRRAYGAEWMRLDVWTSNTALHAYYERQGFTRWGRCETIPGYPSAVLFQKPTAKIEDLIAPLFRVLAAPPAQGGPRSWA